MKFTCAELQSKSDKCGDEHYSNMTRWVIGGLGRSSPNACYKTAVSYDMALEALITRLEKETRSVRTTRQIGFTLKYRSLLAADLAVLVSRGATLA